MDPAERPPEPAPSPGTDERSALWFQRRVDELLRRVRAGGPEDRFSAETAAGAIDGPDLLTYEVLRFAGATLDATSRLASGSARELARLPVHRPELDLATRVLRSRGVPVALDRPEGRLARRRLVLYPAWSTGRALARSLRRRPSGSAPAVPDPPEVLFAAQVAHHVTDLAPVAEHLHEVHGRTVGFLVDDLRTAAAARERGFPVLGPLPASPGGVARAAAAARRVRRAVRQATRRLPDSAESEAFAAAVDRILAAQLRAAFQFVASAAPVVRPDPVRAVVVANPNVYVGRGTARLAERAGIPVVAVEHGSTFPGDPRWAGAPVDRSCVWGPASRRAMLACGVPEESVVVTGSPRHDTTPPVRVADRGPRPARRRVLVATSGPGDHVSLHHHVRVLDLLLGAVRSSPDVAWTIKLHPKDDPAYYARLAAEPGVTLVAPDRVSRSSIFDHLAEADCLVTVASAAALDATRAGVPVVAVWLTDDEPPEFVSRPAAALVRTGDELAAAVARAVRQELPPPPLDYLAEHFAHEGEATRRVAAVVEDLIAGRADQPFSGS